jgi:hypothetical protein
MKNIILGAFAAIVLGAAIASCGNNGNVATATSTPSPVATPSTPCTPPPPPAQIQVVYPIPNSVGVTNLGSIVIAIAPSPLPTNYLLYVGVESTETQTFLGNAFGGQLTVISASQVPQPQLIPPFAFPIYESSSNFGGTFGTGDTFSVFLANTNCFPGTSLNASFNT